MFTTKHVPYHICGAQQDNSTACVGSQANPAAARAACRRSSTRSAAARAATSRPIRSTSNVFYAGSYGGFLSRARSRDRPAARGQHLPEQPDGLRSSIDIKERFQWTFPIVFSPVDPKALYASSQHLWRTTNGGQSWEKISPNLTRSDPKTMQASGGPITKDQTGVETYARDLHDRAVARRTSTRSGPDRTTAGCTSRATAARTGSKVTPPDLPEFARISLIEASPHQNGVAYLAGNRYQMGDRKPVRLQDRRLRQDLDEDRHRHPRHRLRAHDSRGSEAPRPAVSRHRARHLRLVQRRRDVAVAAAEPARHAGARHRRSRSATW